MKRISSFLLFACAAALAACAEFPLAPLACQDSGCLRIDRSHLGQPLTVAGRVFKTGFGVHGTGLVPLDVPLDGTAVRVFTGFVGIDDDEDKIEGDGVDFTISDGSKTLWRSGFMKRGERAKAFSVTLQPGVRRVYLQTFAGVNNWSDHADWCDLSFTDSQIGGASATPGVASFKPAAETAHDFGPEVRAALSRARDTGGGTLDFAKGVYHFYVESAHGLSFHVSNNDHPAYHPVCLPLVGLRGVTLDGHGSRFVLHGSMVAALFMDSENVTLKGVEFEYAEAQNFDVAVVGFESGKTLVKVDETRFPYEVDVNGRIFFKAHGGLRLPVQGCMAFSDKTGEIIERTSDIGLNGKGARRADGLLALNRDISKVGAGVKPGDILSLRNCGRNNPSLVLYRATDTRLEDVVVYNSFGMSLIAQRSENITFRGSKKAADKTAGMFPLPGRRGSVAADATHFSNCKGQIVVENCWFEGMMDDAINVHNTCLSIREMKAPNRILCRYMHGQSVGFETFLPGEAIRFIKGPTLENGWVTQVAAVEKLSRTEVEITLVADVPAGYGVGDAVENADYQPAVNFCGNVVTHNRARGCLFTTPRKVVVKDNVFDTISGSAILFAGDAQGWYESGACHDVLVEGNLFRNNLTSRFQFTEGILSAYPEVRRLGEQKDYYHRNLVIRKNIFETFDVPLLYANSVDGLRFEDNLVAYNSDYQGWGKKPFVLRRVKNFVQARNAVKGRAPFTEADVEQK